MGNDLFLSVSFIMTIVLYQIYYSITSEPPHSTATKPVRSGVVKICSGISTYVELPSHTINTLINVSGEGLMESLAAEE